MANSALKNYFRRWSIIRERPGMIESAAFSVACIALTVAIWYFLTSGETENRIIDRYTLSSPGETLAEFKRLWFERAVMRGAAVSLGRVVGGFVLAAAIGVPLGVLAGNFLRLNAFLKPMSIFGRNIPVAALIPLTLMWFGLGEAQKVMFIFLAAVAFVFFDSTGAVQRVPDSQLDAAYTLGASSKWKNGAIWAGIAGLMYGAVFALAHYWLSQRPGPGDSALWSAWRLHLAVLGTVGFGIGFLLWWPIVSVQAIGKVLLPLAFPDIVNSLRLLFGLAFGYIMLAEVINAEYGLGAIINVSQRQGPREHIYLSLMLIALLAFGIDRGILSLQRYVFPYRRAGDH
jgi:ABC-type nitrate/sulfonate/bicarbonate transport system permease component